MIVLLAAQGPPIAAGQTIEPYTIESTGSATVEVEPDEVEFRFYKRYDAGTLKEKAQQAAQFEQQLRDGLKARQIEPSEIEVSGPVITADIAIGAVLRFRINSLAQQEAPAVYVAGLVETCAGLAFALKCQELKGPFLMVADERPAIQDAIARAVENAYIHAEGAARVLQATILEVRKVRTGEVKWNDAPEWRRSAEPDLKRSSCSAQVTVFYNYTLTPP